MVVAETIPPAVPDQLETLLRQLLPTPVVPTSPPKPIPTELESLLQRLLAGVQAPKPALPPKNGITNMETLLQGLLPGVPVADLRVQLGALIGTGLQWCVSLVVRRGMEWAGAPN